MSFEAKYTGHCSSCECRIEPGETIRYVDDWVEHVDCMEGLVPERPTVTCTECWIIKPCGCDS